MFTLGSWIIMVAETTGGCVFCVGAATLVYVAWVLVIYCEGVWLEVNLNSYAVLYGSGSIGASGDDDDGSGRKTGVSGGGAGAVI